MRSAELLAVAHQTMEPITASLWLRSPVNRARHVSHSRRTACCESRLVLVHMGLGRDRR
jgi:hypothetical protein